MEKKYSSKILCKKIKDLNLVYYTKLNKLVQFWIRLKALVWLESGLNIWGRSVSAYTSQSVEENIYVALLLKADPDTVQKGCFKPSANVILDSWQVQWTSVLH